MDATSRYVFSGQELTDIFNDKLNCLVDAERVDAAVTLLLCALHDKKEPEETKIVHVWMRTDEGTELPEPGKSKEFIYHFEEVLPSIVEFNANVVVWVDDWDNARGAILQVLERHPCYLEVASNCYPDPHVKAALKQEFPYVNIYTIGFGKDLKEGFETMQAFFDRTEPAQRGLRERGGDKLEKDSVAELRLLQSRIKELEAEREQDKMTRKADKKAMEGVKSFCEEFIEKAIQAAEKIGKTIVKEEFNDDIDVQAMSQEDESSNRKRSRQNSENGNIGKRLRTSSTSTAASKGSRRKITIRTTSPSVKSSRPNSPTSERDGRSPATERSGSRQSSVAPSEHRSSCKNRFSVCSSDSEA